VTRLTSVDAASRAIVCSFPSYWNREGMAFALNLCGELSEVIPCHELEFVPNGSVVDLVSTL